MYNKNIKYTQNFIKSEQLASKVVNLPEVDIKEGDYVIEIGPGKGILTNELSKKVGKDGKVLGIEIDTTLCNQLIERYKGSTNIEILNEDILNFKFPSIPYKIFSNIPFNKTSDILNKILVYNTSPQQSYIILQKEAAFMYGGRRIGGPNETLKSLLAYPFFDTRIIYRFNNFDFTPTPGVDIVLLNIEKRKEPLVDISTIGIWENFVTCVSNVRIGEGIWKKIFSENQLKKMETDLGLKIGHGIYQQDVDAILGSFFVFQKYVSQEKKKLIENSSERYFIQNKGISKVYRTRNDKEWMKKQ